MVALLLYLIVMLAISGHSNAAYCVCKQGTSESLLQKNIDYACGFGADCTPILQNGPCFNPNTLQDHCNWAVNSYYQKKGQSIGSCDFAGTTLTSTTSPSKSSSCVYPASPSNGGSTGTPGTGTCTETGTGIPGTTGGCGIAPSGTSYDGADNSKGMALDQISNLAIAVSLAILSSWLMMIIF